MTDGAEGSTTAQLAYGTKETLGNPGDPRDNGPVMAGRDRVDGWQAARLLGLRADHGQEADQA